LTHPREDLHHRRVQQTEDVLPSGPDETVKLTYYLGTARPPRFFSTFPTSHSNVFVAIVETNSGDRTPELLHAFDARWTRSTSRRVLLNDTSIHRRADMDTTRARIKFLAEVRNLMLAPLVARAGTGSSRSARTRSSRRTCARSRTRRLAFRASRLGECFSSECFLLPYDLVHARRAWTRRARMCSCPRVIVGYGWGQFVWWKYITRHWAVHWWIARASNRAGGCRLRA
jgi:hypothetical protein